MVTGVTSSGEFVINEARLEDFKKDVLWYIDRAAGGTGFSIEANPFVTVFLVPDVEVLNDTQTAVGTTEAGDFHLNEAGLDDVVQNIDEYLRRTTRNEGFYFEHRRRTAHLVPKVDYGDEPSEA
ncbi:hypothetical protein [Plantibacter sp. CFBP 8775]|uniref:hypothetical protein n=1 Tax=Plantibacter sp. CFBP 8775 TaxID=2774038 RepID=UPI0017869043|nr:hypothetical protein [Plantibacter sp. CFBP 8775]MBD8102494.1 hypothetical protein [Plantibacter sp. CFBP 8775]